MKHNKTYIMSFILIICLIHCPPVSAYFPGQEKLIDSNLYDQSLKNAVRVIVTMKGYKDIKDLNRIASIQEKVISKMGSHMTQPKIRLENLPIFSTTVFRNGLETLAAMDEVVFIEEDRLQELYTAQGIPLIKPGSFRESYGGAGVAVAIVDSGINYRHPAMDGGSFPNDKVIGGYDFGDNDSDPMDTIGHGTGCASIAAGKNTGSGSYMGGVASEAKIYALKVSQRDGGIPLSAIHGAWDWCITHQYDDPKNPIMIISASLGAPIHRNEYCEDVSPSTSALADKITGKGIAIFVASGNDFQPNGIGFSACLRDTIAIGAVYDSDWGNDPHCSNVSAEADQVICYSNSAKILDLLAPSACAYVAGYPGTRYEECFNGTSAACPYAAGGAALIQSYVKKNTGKFLSVNELKRLMTENGDPVRDRKSGITTPRINIEKSIKAANIGNNGDEGDSPIDELRDIFRDAIR